MRNQYKLAVVSAAVAIALTLQGCASAGHSKIDDQGRATDLDWPKVENAFTPQGVYPNLDNLRAIAQGMTRDQVRALLGPPHYGDTPFGLSEWDYVFWLPTGAKTAAGEPAYKMCQYKAIFKDKNSNLSSTYWNPRDCANLLVKPESVVPVPVVMEVPTPAPVDVQPAPLPQVITLQADSLFKFGRGDQAGMLPGGVTALDEVASKLSSAQSIRSLSVVGHTDRIGSAARNMALGQQRANTVAAYLQSHGVSVPMTTASAGASAPVVDCPGAATQKVIACLQPNRRVEIRVEQVKQ